MPLLRRRRRRREDVEVAGQPHRRDRPAGRDLRADDADPGRAARAVVHGCCSAARSTPASTPLAAKRALAHELTAIYPDERGGRRANPPSGTACRSGAASRARSRRRAFSANGGSCTCPALIAELFGRLALGGPAADRSGRGHARRRAASRRSTSALSSLDGRVAARRPAPVPAPASRRGLTSAPRRRAIVLGSPRAGTVRLPRVPRRDVPGREARRSLKTQQHAHRRRFRPAGVRPGSTRGRMRYRVPLAASQESAVPLSWSSALVYRPRTTMTTLFTESLILAQDERWRRASYMQVERRTRLRPGAKPRTGE